MADLLDPVIYLRVFEGSPDGQAVLEELVRRYGGQPYVRGGQEAERETLVRIGQRRPIDFILGRINAAQGVPEPDQPEEERE